ncbi:MAG: hypothetical protein ACF8PN_03425 [Phycisphaerales bacterium]
MKRVTGSFGGSRVAVAAIAGVAAFAVASTASADVIFSFGFTDLDGDYNAGTQTFTANASNSGDLISSGDVTRQLAPIGSAEFNAGFLGLGTSADYTMSMTLSNITATSADVLAGDASFTVTDADGDTLQGDIIGQWLAGAGGALFFNGALTNVFFTDNGGQDGMFDGPSLGAFSMDFGSLQTFDGAIVTLSVDPTGGFFLESFDDASTLVSAEVVPAPAAFATLGLAGLMAGRRRRRD